MTPAARLDGVCDDDRPAGYAHTVLTRTPASAWYGAPAVGVR